MKNVIFLDDSIIIEETINLLLFTKKKTKQIFLDEITLVSREEEKSENGNELIALMILFGKKEVEFIGSKECKEIEDVYDFLLKQRELGKTYKIRKYISDIYGTDEETYIYY